jgi:hypothetical protein
VLGSVFKELYKHVGQLVIDRLLESDFQEQLQIRQYPAPVFYFLSLHAMGKVSLSNDHKRYFSDIYVFSYILMLIALMST